MTNHARIACFFTCRLWPVGRVLLVCAFGVSSLLAGETCRAQTATGRSQPIPVDVAPEKIRKANLVYTQVGLDDTNLNHTLERNEQAFVRFQVKNTSKYPSQPLLVTTTLAETVPGLEWTAVLKINPIPAGKSQQVRVPVHTTGQLTAGTATFVIEIREELLYAADQIELSILTEPDTAQRE